MGHFNFLETPSQSRKTASARRLQVPAEKEYDRWVAADNKKGDDLAHFQPLGVAFTASRFGRFNNRIG
jgi:hypothetical protein